MKTFYLSNLHKALICLLVACAGFKPCALAQHSRAKSLLCYSFPNRIGYTFYPPMDIGAFTSSQKWHNSPLKGGLFGFVIGGTGGVILGLTGKDWVLDNGKVVSRPVHALVDLFIVATPTTLIGVIVGARRDRSTLETSRLHAAIGGGWTGAMTYNSMLNAYDISGIDRHIPHWFGYLHYPSGDNSSVPYTWNLSVDYNLMPRWTIGAHFNNFVKQQIKGGNDHHHPSNDHEYAQGETYSLFTDYILNPIRPENKTRLEFGFGAGVALHNLKVGGSLGNTSYKEQKYNVTPHVRATADYYSRKNLSLQLKVGYRPRQLVRVPEQTDGSRTLIAHAVNFRAVDITLGVRYHFNKK